MPLDASIPLSYNPTPLMSPAQLISLKDLSLRTQMDQQDVQQRQAVTQALQQPGSVQNGRLTPVALNQITQINPQLGIQLAGQQEQLRMRDLAISEKKQQRGMQIEKAYVESFDRHLQSTGGNRQESQRLASQDRLLAIDEFEKSGEAAQMGFNEQDLNRARSQMRDPDQVRAIVTSQGGTFAPAKQPLSDVGKLKADLDAGRISKKDYDLEVAKKTAPTAAMTDPKGFEGKNGELLAALAEKGVSLPAGFRSKSQQLGLLNALRERNPSLSADEIAEKVKNGQIDLANVKKAGQVAAGIAGKVAYAENEIQQTIPLVREASAKLPRGEFIPFNKLKQMGEAKFSDPNLAEFRMYMTSLSNAYDMLAARGGTDVEKRAESRKNFDTAQSAEALERVLQAVQKEAQASGRAAQAAMKPPGKKEPEKATSKSGRPMHKNEDGKWEYD